MNRLRRRGTLLRALLRNVAAAPGSSVALPAARLWKSLGHLILLALPLAAGSQSLSRYDPVRDTLATSSGGVWKIVVPAGTLMESVRASTAALGTVAEMKIGQIGRDPYLIFKGNRGSDPGTGFFLAVRLKEAAPGAWMADQVTQTCTGAPCNACSFAGGACACESHYDPNHPLDTGFCNHSISTRLALAPVESKE
jgi:hypothetical protein